MKMMAQKFKQYTNTSLGPHIHSPLEKYINSLYLAISDKNQLRFLDDNNLPFRKFENAWKTVKANM